MKNLKNIRSLLRHAHQANWKKLFMMKIFAPNNFKQSCFAAHKICFIFKVSRIRERVAEWIEKQKQFFHCVTKKE
jgi:hypothetical protein